MKLVRLSDRTQVEGTCMLLYGAAGRGKTFWASSANGDRTVVVTDGNGITTMKSPDWKERNPGVNPILLEVQSDKDPLQPRAYDFIRNLVDSLFTDNKDEFDTLVIDDIDFVRESAMGKGIVMNSQGDKPRSQTANNNRSQKFGNIMMISQTQGDYQTEMRLVDGFLQQLTDGCRREGKNLIICAHERTIRKKDERGNEYVYKVNPLFTGVDTPDNIARYFDMVWYIRTVGTGSNVKREFITQSEGAYDCKTRWGRLFPNPLREVTSQYVFNRIKHYQETGETK